MPSNRYPIIAREGWPVLALLLVVLGVAYYFHFLGDTVAVITAAVMLVSLFLLRDPAQIIPTSPLSIVSPVFGRIVSVEEVNDPWVERQALQIRIKMSLFDIYSLRSPMEGKIVNQWTRRPEGKTVKRKFAFRIRSDEGDEVVVVVYLNLFGPLSFRFYAHSGERLGHGQRCGYLYFAGTIDVLVPKNSKISVKSGDKISSGSGVLAHLVHNNGTASVIHDDQDNDLKQS
jgi:phosphatidylserine decarboxylase